MIRYAIVSVTSRSIVYVCEAESKDAAIAAAVTALDRARAPASWDTWPVTDLPVDLQTEAAAWVHS